MLWFLKSRFGPHVKPMNVISIERKTIYRNLEILQKLQPKGEIFPVLKSNAYGHGLKQMVKILRRTDVPYLVVDSFPEYQVAKKYSNKDILLLWETLLENYRYFDARRVTFCVYNKWTIETLAKLHKREVKIHLFLNTGMNREWIQEEELLYILDEIKKFPNIMIEWVMSHLHSADEQSYNGVEEQITKFKKLYHMIIDSWHVPTRKHIGNSAGMVKVHDDFFNARRPGIAMYGYNPLSADDPDVKKLKNLKPALSVTSRIISTQIAWPGEGVGYHHRYKPYDRELMVTIPFGYAEWLPRNASGNITMKRWRTALKQVGRISMNLCTCKVENDALCSVGEKVEIISSSPSDPNSLAALAQASDTIVYECLVRLDKSMRREIV